jgi:hypothetical protein
VAARRRLGAPATWLMSGDGSSSSSTRPDWYGLPTTDSAAAEGAGAGCGGEAGTAAGNGWSMEGMALTVCGPLLPEQLGATMMQEHLLINLSSVNAPQSVAGPTGEHFWRRPCASMEVSGGLRFYSLMNEEDSQLTDIGEAIEGIELFKQHGGGTVVSPTGSEIGRDPHGLRRISLATGVAVVMGTGHYLGAAQDDDLMETTTVEQIAATFVAEITQGAAVHQANPMHRDGGWSVPTVSEKCV